MPFSDCWSEILAISSRLLRLSSLLTLSYERLPEIIVAEHSAIKANDFKKVQETGQKKTALGELIDQHFSKFRAETAALFHVARVRLEIVDIEGKGYSEVIALFDRMIEKSGDFGFVAAEVAYRRSLLALAFSDFRKKFELIQPLIEMNRTVVRTMLEHQQQSFRFWSEIVQEESSSYDAFGSRKSKGGGSLISIQA